MTDLRNAVEDRPTQYNNTNISGTYGAAEPSFGTRNAGYGSTPSAAPMPATDYYQSRWDQLKDQSWFPMAVVGGVIALFTLFVGYAYNQGSSDAGAGGTAPVIAAADQPFKTAPTDAGGMVVPNQDTLVFDQIAQPTATTTDGQAAATETLVPPPEAPLVSADDAAIKAAATETPAATTTAPVAEATQTAPQPAPATTVAAMTAGENAPKPAPAAAAPTTPAAPAPAVEAPKPVVKAPEAPKPVAKVAETPKAVAAPKPAPTPAPAPKAVAPTPAPMPAPAPAPVAQTKPAVLPPVATTPSPAAAPTPMPTPVAAAPAPAPAVSSGTAKVQLGAFGSEAAARAAWQTFQQKYGAQLGGVTPNFARADLGAKGVVYRVQGVGLSATSATSICQAINAQAAGGCIVAK